MSDERFDQYVAKLSDEDALRLHRIACRRASRIYGVMHREVQRTNYELAMAANDTRFVKGLSALENMERSHALGRRRTRAA